MYAPGWAMMEFVRLAHARYPDDSLDQAIAFFASDRRTAGLGALDERRRAEGQGNGYVRNRKWFDALSKAVHYARDIDVPPRQEIPPIDFDTYVVGAALAADCVTITLRPARKISIRLRVDARDLQDQRGRCVVAARLRELRRQCFAAGDAE